MPITSSAASFKTALASEHSPQLLSSISHSAGPTTPTLEAAAGSMAPVENTARLLEFIRSRDRPVPIIYTTSPYHPDCGDQPFKSAADKSAGFRPWDERACQIDSRVAPTSRDLVIEKENASAFFGTHLIGYLVQHKVDTLLITGCSTSACIRATATDAKSYRLKPVIIRDCVGDRAEAAHEWTLFDIQARFADVEPLDRVLDYLGRL